MPPADDIPNVFFFHIPASALHDADMPGRRRACREAECGSRAGTAESGKRTGDIDWLLVEGISSLQRGDDDRLVEALERAEADEVRLDGVVGHGGWFGEAHEASMGASCKLQAVRCWRVAGR